MRTPPMASDRNLPGASPAAPTGFGVRSAQPADAEEATAVLRASISVLCVADHDNDPEFLARWLENKTPRNVRTWTESPGRFVVAEEPGRIVGVGTVLASGEITLNYVLPEARFRGVSKAVLDSLEGYLCANGTTRATLVSTRTAHRFYRAMGYVDVGQPEVADGLAEFRMFKYLSTPAPGNGVTPPASFDRR